MQRHYRRAISDGLALVGAFMVVAAIATLTRYGPAHSERVTQFVALVTICAVSWLIAFRFNRARPSRAALTGHVVLFQAPVADINLGRTPPIGIRGPRDAIERFIPLTEFSTLFGGLALWAPSTHPTPELPDEALGVWGRRTCQRFRRILRERGATLELRKEAGPPQRLVQLRRE